VNNDILSYKLLDDYHFPSIIPNWYFGWFMGWKSL